MISYLYALIYQLTICVIDRHHVPRLLYDNQKTRGEESDVGWYRTSVDIANLETKLLDGFSNLKDEAINVKDVIIRNLQEENAKLRSKVEVLENEFNHLEVQYCRHNDIEVSGIPDSIGDNELECSVIKIIKTIDIEDDYRDI